MSIKRDIEVLEDQLQFGRKLTLPETFMVIEFSDKPHLRIQAFEQYREGRIKKCQDE